MQLAPLSWRQMCWLQAEEMENTISLFSPTKKKLEINKFAPEGMEEFISGNTYYTLNLTNAYEEHSASF